MGRLIKQPSPQRRIPNAKGSRSLALSADHKAAIDGRTLFSKSVVSADQSPRVLIDGRNQRKIGKRIVKGPWKGARVFTLTLEERATCPRSCRMWLSCYGNNMHWSRRHKLDKALFARLESEVAALVAKHGRIAVRLHVMGDFGSRDNLEIAFDYVALWRWLLHRHAGLHVFGFTAHSEKSLIGISVMSLNVSYPARCRIRFSGTDNRGTGALVIARLADAKHVVCPAQLEKTDCCATCGLCWLVERPIEFLRHGSPVLHTGQGRIEL
mgnify:FL=1